MKDSVAVTAAAQCESGKMKADAAGAVAEAAAKIRR